MNHELSAFPNFEHTTPVNVHMGKLFRNVNGKRDGELLFSVSGSAIMWVLWEILFVPSLKYCLISVGNLSCHCIHASFHCFGVIIS